MRRSTSSPTRASRSRAARSTRPTITPALLEDTLQEADAIEANVATGYHAIEFLLWGQDLNGTGPGAGNRPWTDYAAGDACTGGNCDRRAAYLKAATDLLVSDLEWMVGAVGRRRRGAHGGDGRSRRRHRRDPDRHGQPLLRRAGRRADAARADAARPGGGARLLLGQHLQQPLLRRARASGTSISAATSAPTAAWSRGRRSRSWWPRPIRRSTPSCARRSTRRWRRSARSRPRARPGTHYDQLLATGNAAGEALVMGGDRRADRPDPLDRAGGLGARASRRSPSRAPTASTTPTRCSSRGMRRLALALALLPRGRGGRRPPPAGSR